MNDMRKFLNEMLDSGDSQQLCVADFLLDILDQDGEEHTVGCAQVLAEVAMAFVKQFKE